VRLLLLSNSTSEAGYLVHALDQIVALAQGEPEAVFVPYAGVARGWDDYAAMVAEALAPAGIAVRPLHRAADPAALASAAPLVLVGGGNTFNLLHHCRRGGVLAALKARDRAGLRFVGWSAGANLVCPTIRTTNDMPVVDPGGLDALGLIPFQINPHYTNASPPGHRGETRDQRLAEFLVLNPDVPVLALPEGDWLRVSDESMELGGGRAAWWMRHGRPPLELRDGPLRLP
jgi:dipeptidase E